MKAVVNGPDGKEHSVHMGSYGIGPTRLAAALIEANHDENGAIWPEAAAPFQVGLINLKVGDAACDGACERIYAALEKAGVDVLYDDRDERPGAKFAAMDLIGAPHQVIVGPKSLAEGKVEVKTRRSGERELVSLDAAIAKLGGHAAGRCSSWRARALPAPDDRDRRAERGRGPFAPFEWMVAFRYLRARNAQRSISVIAGFSFLGIVLGVAALIVVMSVMNGFRHDLMDKMIGLNGHMFLQGVETPLTDYDAVTERVSKVPGVTLALPLVEGQAFASSPYGSSGALVRGIRGSDLERLPGVAGHITQGSLDGFDSGQGVAVGSKLAEHLSLSVGDKITIIAPHGAETPFGVTPRMKTYTVAAIFQIGMSTFDNTFIFMPLPEAQTFFNYDGQASVIEVYVADPDDMDAMRRKIEPAQQRPMIDTDWRQLNRSFFDVLAVESNVMFAILTLIMLVAALNIISGLIMLVQDKARAHRGPAHDGRDARRDHAHLSHHRRDDRLRRHRRRPRARAPRRVQRRADPQGPELDHRRQSLSLRILFPVATALAGRNDRRRLRRRDGADPVARGDHLSVLARRAARSGRGAAL